MKLIDGKLVAQTVYDSLKDKVAKLNEKPCLAVVLVGDKPESKTYVNMKNKKCKELGIKSLIIKLDENIRTNFLVSEIDRLNNDNSVNGILVQLPLPDHIDKNAVLSKIDVKKDVDGLNVLNMGSLTLNNNPLFYPCTPLGCIKLIDYYNIDICGKHAVVIGKSQIVGMPLAIMLMNLGATVSICDDKTINIKKITKSADILFTACGCPNLVNDKWIKDGVNIIDIGITKVEDPTLDKGYKLVGDVDFDSVKDKVNYITPVPGGVGPMTIATLMEQTIKSLDFV